MKKLEKDKKSPNSKPFFFRPQAAGAAGSACSSVQQNGLGSACSPVQPNSGVLKAASALPPQNRSWTAGKRVLIVEKSRDSFEVATMFGLTLTGHHKTSGTTLG
ncbi:Uncharacterized protein Fot_05387 [Forsythia ovata]|uniref:Uncharacterized protein n=1 Tax=Forsythia ovata TaxID=205694 RepID=A0ABD1WST8_9LAMI